MCNIILIIKTTKGLKAAIYWLVVLQIDMEKVLDQFAENAALSICLTNFVLFITILIVGQGKFITYSRNITKISYNT
ncbi:MAG: hypothetical protein DHS20C20_04630 [Ardenticatenaceae bacterium]|nr:MAG: hypothetical protein DHS20C20_04630 [Ardenticatenaceae bacterium]